MTGSAPGAAIVTGAAHGIGRGIVDRLRADGLTVHPVDRDQADLSDTAAATAFFERVAGDGLDVLVNVAGGVVGRTHTPIDEVADADWDAVLDANLRTMMICCRLAAKIMKPRRYGRIVTISSGAGLGVSLTGIQAYAAAKAAQIALTRQLAHELGPFGITVNCVAPGFLRTNPDSEAQWQSYGEQGQADLLAGIPVGRLGDPADIANAVAFFASPAAGWITGQTLAVDGGHTLR